MSQLVARFAAVVLLVVSLSGLNSANFWRPPIRLPSNPKDQYYESFQNVSSPNVTASKLMTNFLHIRPKTSDRTRRQSPMYIEDIVVVMDGSGSIQRCEFNKGKKALKHMMSLASVSGSDANYAAVTFASSVDVNFKFLPYSKAAIEIIKIPYPGGGTNTQAGLTEAKKLFDDPSSGRRYNSRKMVFLVTDGQSNDEQLSILKADALKNSGVQIFVVAVGGYIYGIDEMVKVASYPPQHFLFRVKTLQQFWHVVKLIIKEVSPGKYAVVDGQNDPSC